MNDLAKMNHFTSLTAASYTNKGNPLTLRSTLDTAKKEDLRTNHFTIGGPSACLRKSTSQVYFTAGTAAQRAACMSTLNEEKKKDLRASHWSVSHQRPSTPSAHPYVTQDMVNFRWIQPVPRRFK